MRVSDRIPELVLAIVCVTLDAALIASLAHGLASALWVLLLGLACDAILYVLFAVVGSVGS